MFGILVFVYGGWVFIQGAMRELRPGWMTLISLAISLAFIFSAVVTFGYPGTPLGEGSSTLVTVVLLGHWLRTRSINQAQGAINELARTIA